MPQVDSEGTRDDRADAEPGGCAHRRTAHRQAARRRLAHRGAAVVVALLALAATTPAQLDAEFSATPLSGSQPLEVAFTDLSTGDPLIWVWSFGDGTTSFEQHPTHVYEVAETTTFSVSLLVSTGFPTSTETKTDYITVTPAPLVVDFDASPPSGVQPLEVAFTDLSAGAPVDSWLWDFGDGATSPAQHPTHTYVVATPTTFDVSLTVSFGPQQETLTKRDLVSVSPAPLAADFTASTTAGVNPLTVDFTDTTTGGAPSGWLWDFGDGDVSTQQHPTHVFDDPGTWTVSLTVSLGPQQDTVTMPDLVTVEPAPLAPDFTAAPVSGPTPLTVAFTDTTTGGAPDAWLWDFGDGGTSTLQHPSHAFLMPGDHTVQLTAFLGSQSATVTKTDIVHVDHAPLGLPVFDARTFAVGRLPLRIDAADLDADGVMDLTLGLNDDGEVVVLRGQGEGGFERIAAIDLGLSASVTDLHVSDLDADGRPDVVVTLLGSFANSAAAVLRGTGDGGLGAPIPVDPGVDAAAVAVGDYDEDGTTDLVVAEYSHQLRIHHGDGAGDFTPGAVITLPVERPLHVEARDLDGDGHLDLGVVCLSDGVTKLDDPTYLAYLGAGDGTFALAENIALLDDAYDAAYGDFDGDGIPDVALPGYSTGGVRVLRGLGDGSFGAGGTFPVAGQGPVTVIAGRIDGDAVDDLVTADRDTDSVSVLLGTGDGGFLPAVRRFAVGGMPSGAVIADFDGDGVADVAAANVTSETVTVLRGAPDGTLRDNVRHDDPGVLSVATGDVDGDGLTDVVLSRADGSLHVRLGLGDGAFADGPSHPGNWGQSDLALADMDGDGVLDAVIAAVTSDAVVVRRGVGDGSFVGGGYAFVGVQPAALAVGDVDGDLVPDVVTADTGSDAVTVLLGQGGGALASAGRVAVSAAPTAVVLGDWDGDGALDLAAAGGPERAVTVRLGQGDGTFAGGAAYVTGGTPAGLASGDLDGDGDADLVVTDRSGGSVAVLLGAGDGAFEAPVSFDAGVSPRGVVLVDLDLDGALDVALVDETMDVVTVLPGDGAGALGRRSSFAAGDRSFDLAVGLFDADGHPDVVTGGFGNWAVLVNRLDAWFPLGSGLPGVSGIPYLAGTGALLPGSPGSLVLTAGAPSAPAVMFLSVTSTPVPFYGGTLVPFPWLVAQPRVTDASGGLVLAWPSWPGGLSGQDLYLQCGMLDPAAVYGVSLSNALRADVP